ncbi:hypothetical protein [Methylorubrum populi]|uniref:Uncharacterized protein n=1 Tax=Methylorubrum populi TaxID=223967 RepID=A0A833J9A8_9HYPH|nr:hypothetical protein [Methylorubrum populi]KAB7785997.1 hypothetical protein F8B43_1398 [Methylorubrum populi]
MRNPLRNVVRRPADRPTLKQRAAALKATAARVLRRPSPPDSVSAPGSPEAVTAFHVACSEFDRRTHLSDAEYERLRIGDSPLLWTSKKVRDALDGRASSSGLSRGDLQDLLVITLRRDLAMQEALRDLRLNELFACAFPSDSDEHEATPSSADFGADPQLLAMVADLLEARRKLNDPSVPDGPEADAISEQETALSIAVHRFPARSIHDMAAKLPFLREEAEDAARGWDGRRAPFEASLPGAAWAGLLRDIEHLAGVPAVVAASHEPDSIFAAITASRAAQAAMEEWVAKTNATPKLTGPDFAEEDRLNKAQYEAHDAVIATVPTTAAGRLALLEYLRWQMRLHGMTDGEPPEAGSPFWRDAYKALRAALAFEGEAVLSAPQQRETAAPRNLSKEAFDYAYALDLSNVSFTNLWRLYEAFSAAYESLWPVAAESMFDEGTAEPCCEHTPGGRIVDAEANRMGCLRDAIAGELRRRTPQTEGQRDIRLEVLIEHEMRCETKIRDKALLAELNAAWGA